MSLLIITVSVVLEVKPKFSHKALDRVTHSLCTPHLIAELAERSPIIIQNISNPASRKNLDVQPYDRTTVQGATFNMCGQLYRGYTNATALSSSPVVSALDSDLDDPGSSS